MSLLTDMKLRKQENICSKAKKNNSRDNSRFSEKDMELTLFQTKELEPLQEKTLLDGLASLFSSFSEGEKCKKVNTLGHEFSIVKLPHGAESYELQVIRKETQGVKSGLESKDFEVSTTILNCIEKFFQISEDSIATTEPLNLFSMNLFATRTFSLTADQFSKCQKMLKEKFAMPKERKTVKEYDKVEPKVETFCKELQESLKNQIHEFIEISAAAKVKVRSIKENALSPNCKRPKNLVRDTDNYKIIIHPKRMKLSENDERTNMDSIVIKFSSENGSVWSKILSEDYSHTSILSCLKVIKERLKATIEDEFGIFTGKISSGQASIQFSFPKSQK